jgi:hypothetical protein
MQILSYPKRPKMSQQTLSRWSTVTAEEVVQAIFSTVQGNCVLLAEESGEESSDEINTSRMRKEGEYLNVAIESW